MPQFDPQIGLRVVALCIAVTPAIVAAPLAGLEVARQLVTLPRGTKIEFCSPEGAENPAQCVCEMCEAAREIDARDVSLN